MLFPCPKNISNLEETGKKHRKIIIPGKWIFYEIFYENGYINVFDMFEFLKRLTAFKFDSIWHDSICTARSILYKFFFKFQGITSHKSSSEVNSSWHQIVTEFTQIHSL